MKTIEEIKQLLIGPCDFRITYSIYENSKLLFSEKEGIILKAENKKEALKSFDKLFNEKSRKFRVIIKSIVAEY